MLLPCYWTGIFKHGFWLAGSTAGGQSEATLEKNLFNTQRPGQNGHRRFCARYFQICFLVWKLLYFFLNLTEICSHSKDPSNNKSSMVQIMAGHRTGHKPLSEPAMLAQLMGFLHSLHLPHVAMTSRGRQCVSNHQQFDCLFEQLAQTNKKNNWFFVREIHRWRPSKRASDAERVSMSLYHHDLKVKTLYVLNFSEGTKIYISFYVIPPHWFDTGT